MLVKKALQRFRVRETAYGVVKHEVRFLSAHFCVSVFRAKLRKSNGKDTKKWRKKKLCREMETGKAQHPQGVTRSCLIRGTIVPHPWNDPTSSVARFYLVRGTILTHQRHTHILSDNNAQLLTPNRCCKKNLPVFLLRIPILLCKFAKESRI